ncbi:MBL fold metallo-hydrolase [Clostridium gelidum]|uniref:MBL fold metallo-hydrolase n=1 Tax=Clostridium gelidum TaxID=704125 RepID=A0ABN6J2V1_9CLOT|nr:MBL fold metallo-hydrolase [Clostridium gelidum]
MLECGINIKDIKQGLDFDLSKVKGCLVTHEHKDHCKSINNILAAGIDVYMSQGTAKGMEFLDERYSYRFNYLRHKVPKNIAGFTIIPFNVQHDVNEPLGFLIYHPTIGKIVFATDTYSLLNITFKNVDHILIECNYFEGVLQTLPVSRAIRLIKSHMSLENLIETLKSWELGNTKDITLIHISNDNGEPERFQQEIETLTGIKTYVAEPGLIVGR